jgi:hypothetical protein
VGVIWHLSTSTTNGRLYGIQKGLVMSIDVVLGVETSTRSSVIVCAGARTSGCGVV